MYDFFEPGEQLIMEGVANMQPIGGAAKGGKLILTERRLVFVTNAVEPGVQIDQILLSRIARSGEAFGIFSDSSNTIRVDTTDGKQTQFTVDGTQKGMWLQMIFAAVQGANARSTAVSMAAQPQVPTPPPVPNPAPVTQPPAIPAAATPTACAHCGAPMPNDVKFCGQCGYVRTQEEPSASPEIPNPHPYHYTKASSYCANCGAAIDATASFCNECGNPVTTKPSSQPARSMAPAPMPSLYTSQPLVQSVSYAGQTSVAIAAPQNNKWVMMLALLPLLSGLVAFICPPESMMELVASIVIFIGNILLLVLDKKELLKAGYISQRWMNLGYLLPPLYLFIRAKKTDKKYRYGVLWCVFLVFAIISVGFFSSNQNTTDTTSSINQTMADPVEIIKTSCFYAYPDVTVEDILSVGGVKSWVLESSNSEFAKVSAASPDILIRFKLDLRDNSWEVTSLEVGTNTVTGQEMEIALPSLLDSWYQAAKDGYYGN